MNKFVIFFALVASVFAEPPSNYGAPQQSYQSYSAPSYSAPSSSGYSSYDDSSSYVDDALLARIAQLLEQSEYSSGSSSGYSSPSSSYGTPSTYGAPSSSGGILLGRIERAQRIAEFDLTENRSGGYSGGYSQGGYN